MVGDERQIASQDAASRAEGEQPAYTPVSRSWLKASYRGKDQARSTPQRPFYTHSNPQPLAPGVIHQFDIEVPPVAYVFKKGHRIRLELANGDSPATDGVFSHPYHPSLMGTDTVHHDAIHASRIILPVLVAKRDLARAPSTSRPPPSSSFYSRSLAGRYDPRTGVAPEGSAAL
jgi:hypothetical protein